MENIDIKAVTPNDIEQLQYISRQTFYETFAAENSEEDMANYLGKWFSAEQLAVELANNSSVFYFAVQGGRSIGYLKLNFGQAQTELKDDNAIEIERIYVLNEFHGKRVGQLLYEKAMEIAKQRSAAYVWLGVWEKNTRAIRFYEKNGFVAFDSHIFKLGSDEQTDILMRRPLKTK